MSEQDNMEEHKRISNELKTVYLKAVENLKKANKKEDIDFIERQIKTIKSLQNMLPIVIPIPKQQVIKSVDRPYHRRMPF